MANIASQIKRNHQNERARQRNRAVRSKLKTQMRGFELAVSTGDRDGAEQAYRETARKLDKAASKGVVHQNYAANKKSRMSKVLQRL